MRFYFYTFIASFLLSLSAPSALARWFLADMQYFSLSESFEKDDGNFGNLHILVMPSFCALVSTSSFKFLQMHFTDYRTKRRELKARSSPVFKITLEYVVQGALCYHLHMCVFDNVVQRFYNLDICLLLHNKKDIQQCLFCRLLQRCTAFYIRKDVFLFFPAIFHIACFSSVVMKVTNGSEMNGLNAGAGPCSVNDMIGDP